MKFVNTNKNTLLIFLNSLDEQTNNLIFDNIKRTLKVKISVDYRQDFTEILKTTEHYIQKINTNPNTKMPYENIVLMGEGYAADIANCIAHRLSLRALLINPTFDKQPFLTQSNEDTHVIINNDDEAYNKLAKARCNNLPNNWEVDFTKEEFGKYFAFWELITLCKDGFSWIDDAEFFGEG